jgi:hypothetical protein
MSPGKDVKEFGMPWWNNGVGCAQAVKAEDTKYASGQLSKGNVVGLAPLDCMGRIVDYSNRRLG